MPRSPAEALAPANPEAPLVTRSRHGDWLLLALIALAIVGFSARLRVYHEVPRWAARQAATEAFDDGRSAAKAPERAQ